MISVPQNPARAERAFPPALLIVCWLLVWTTTAHAHDPGLSVLTLRLGATEISARLIISESETAAVPARGPVRLVCDGRELTASPYSINITTNGQDVVWNFSWARLAGRELEIYGVALATLPRGHRQFVKVVDEKDAPLSTTLLSAEQARLRVTLPAAAAPVPRHSSWPGWRGGFVFAMSLAGLGVLVWRAGKREPSTF